MHKIEQAIAVFLENIESTTVTNELIEEFGNNCKKSLRECLLAKRGEEPFKLRMSNIGRPLRQLMLDKQYGRPKMDSESRLRMTYGYIWESFLLFLMKAAGLDIETNKHVKLNVAYDKDKSIAINGTFDLKYEGEIYDIKSCSPWAFDNKFSDFNTLSDSDDFGYVGQGIGYSLADKSYFGGWIAIDKSNGRIKVVEVPKENYRELCKYHLDDFKTKIKCTLGLMSYEGQCEGVIKETFRKVPTGNLILNKSCEFCPHKRICHPELKYKESLVGEAKNKQFKYYVKINESN